MIDMIVNLIFSFAFILITKGFMDMFLDKRDMSILLFICSWCEYYIIEGIATKVITVPIVNLFFEIIVTLILCQILYEGSIGKKLIGILIINLLEMIAEMIVGYAFILLNSDIKNAEILDSFISTIVKLMILICLKFINNVRLRRDIPIAYWCILFSIPIGSIYILNTLFFLCEMSKDNNKQLPALLSSVLILGINFLVFFFYEKISDRLEYKKQQIELYKNHIKERKTASINIRNINHDINNHLICIKEYVERENWDYANKYIDELIRDEKSFGNVKVIHSGNIVVDALLNYKISIMEKLGIEMNSHIEIPEELSFSDADISVIIGNCIDNAIESVSKLKDEKAKNVRIEIVCRKNNLIFQISNPYSETIRQDKQGNFITTKKDAKKHGIGLNSVKCIADKYNGLVTINSENNTFCVKVLLYA